MIPRRIKNTEWCLRKHTYNIMGTMLTTKMLVATRHLAILRPQHKTKEKPPGTICGSCKPIYGSMTNNIRLRVTVTHCLSFFSSPSTIPITEMIPFQLQNFQNILIQIWLILNRTNAHNNTAYNTIFIRLTANQTETFFQIFAPFVPAFSKVPLWHVWSW